MSTKYYAVTILFGLIPGDVRNVTQQSFSSKMYSLQTKPYQHFIQVSLFTNSTKTILATHSPTLLKHPCNLAGSAKISAILKTSKINIELTFLTGSDMGRIHLC